jgi:hypothetical protein
LLPAFLGGLLVALFSHRGALGHAQIFGHLVKTAFDLHRGKLLKQFRLRAPGSLGEERVLWPAVCSFLYRVDLSKVDVWQYRVAADGGDDETEDDE